MESYFAGKSIFLTGVTGFLGKVILEKILRSFPQILTIYVLVRPKKGDSVQCRMNKIFRSKLFSKLDLTNKDIFKKVVPISGDISIDNLGLSESDLKLLISSVSIVIHAAANVNFDPPLRVAINTNVFGTRRILELCSSIKSLDSLVYVSTAYSNCDFPESFIKEKVYPAPVGALELLEKMDLMSDEFLADNLQSILGTKPNNYVFSKCLAENIVRKRAKKLGINYSIVRPSIVGCSWIDPFPGWTEGQHGANGVFLGIMSGLLNIIKLSPKVAFDLIPVDIVANLILASAWDNAVHGSNGNVYNCCSGPLNKQTAGEFLNRALKASIKNYPSGRGVFYPNVRATMSETWCSIGTSLFQFIPAYCIDIICYIKDSLTKVFCRGKLKSTSTKLPKLSCIQHKIVKGRETVKYFNTNGWNFKIENVLRLEETLQNCTLTSELPKWEITCRDLDWEEYSRIYCLGLRRFVLREDDKTIPQSLDRIERLRYRWRLLATIVIISLLVLLGGLVFLNLGKQQLNTYAALVYMNSTLY